MNKLDSNELIKELNKLQKYDMNFNHYEPFLNKDEYGDYIKFDDIEYMIKDMISND